MNNEVDGVGGNGGERDSITNTKQTKAKAKTKVPTITVNKATVKPSKQQQQQQQQQLQLTASPREFELHSHRESVSSVVNAARAIIEADETETETEGDDGNEKSGDEYIIKVSAKEKKRRAGSMIHMNRFETVTTLNSVSESGLAASKLRNVCQKVQSKCTETFPKAYSKRNLNSSENNDDNKNTNNNNSSNDDNDETDSIKRSSNSLNLNINNLNVANDNDNFSTGRRMSLSNTAVVEETDQDLATEHNDSNHHSNLHPNKAIDDRTANQLLSTNEIVASDNNDHGDFHTPITATVAQETITETVVNDNDDNIESRNENDKSSTNISKHATIDYRNQTFRAKMGKFASVRGDLPMVSFRMQGSKIILNGYDSMVCNFNKVVSMRKKYVLYCFVLAAVGIVTDVLQREVRYSCSSCIKLVNAIRVMTSITTLMLLVCIFRYHHWEWQFEKLDRQFLRQAPMWSNKRIMTFVAEIFVCFFHDFPFLDVHIDVAITLSYPATVLNPCWLWRFISCDDLWSRVSVMSATISIALTAVLVATIYQNLTLLPYESRMVEFLDHIQMHRSHKIVAATAIQRAYRFYKLQSSETAQWTPLQHFDLLNSKRKMIEGLYQFHIYRRKTKSVALNLQHNQLFRNLLEDIDEKLLVLFVKYFDPHQIGDPMAKPIDLRMIEKINSNISALSRRMEMHTKATRIASGGGGGGSASLQAALLRQQIKQQNHSSILSSQRLQHAKEYGQSNTNNTSNIGVVSSNALETLDSSAALNSMGVNADQPTSPGTLPSYSTQLSDPSPLPIASSSSQQQQQQQQLQPVQPVQQTPPATNIALRSLHSRLDDLESELTRLVHSISSSSSALATR